METVRNFHVCGGGASRIRGLFRTHLGQGGLETIGRLAGLGLVLGTSQSRLASGQPKPPTDRLCGSRYGPRLG